MTWIVIEYREGDVADVLLFEAEQDADNLYNQRRMDILNSWDKFHGRELTGDDLDAAWQMWKDECDESAYPPTEDIVLWGSRMVNLPASHNFANWKERIDLLQSQISRWEGAAKEISRHIP